MADVRHYEDYNEGTNEWEEGMVAGGLRGFCPFSSIAALQSFKVQKSSSLLLML